MGLRLGKPRSSTQAGYHITFSIEVNDVEKMVIRFGDVGHQIEEGTLIGITRRIYVRSIVSNVTITTSIIRGDLKPKGMLMYGWCRY